MKQAIETRELVVLNAAKGIVRGTYHKAYEESSSSQSNPVERNRIGVLFLNSLSPTRAADGDSAVYWADAFAELGYPSFRLDFQGFGDSDGEPPTELLNFVNTGGYASAASTQINELVGRFNLSGVVIVGLCAGAVSALYAAGASKKCKGLVMMDPYFFLPLVAGLNVSQKLTRRILRTAPGKLMSRAYERMRKFGARLPGNSRPPSNANFPLLQCWKKVASAGLPILVLRAPHTNFKVGDFDYLSYLLELAGTKSQVVVSSIEGTGHSFSNRVGLVAVRQQIENWLKAYFPLKKHAELGGNTLHSEPDDNTVRNHATRIACTANLSLGK
jgi:pimeloyl-ACP methyl ester carboxylesterase